MKKTLSVALYSILLTAFILFSFDFYLSKKHYMPATDEFLENPAKYAGMKSEFTGTFVNATKESFYMRVNQKPLKVYYSGIEKPRLGQVNIMAELNKDGTARAIEIHAMSYNYLKYFISGIGFILFLAVFLREWKIGRGGFIENA